MSEVKVKTGKGKKGYLMEVSSRGRAQTDGVVTAEFADASVTNSDAYVAISTITDITTTGTEHAIQYLKNTGDNRIRIHSIRACGDQLQNWRIYKNPTAIVGGTASNVTNLDLSSPKAADVDAQYGVDGSTFTGGTMMDHFQNDIGHSEEVFTGGLVMSRGDSIGLTVELATGGEVCSRILFYVEQS